MLARPAFKRLNLSASPAKRLLIIIAAEKGGAYPDSAVGLSLIRVGRYLAALYLTEGRRPFVLAESRLLAHQVEVRLERA